MLAGTDHRLGEEVEVRDEEVEAEVIDPAIEDRLDALLGVGEPPEIAGCDEVGSMRIRAVAVGAFLRVSGEAKPSPSLKTKRRR